MTIAGVVGMSLVLFAFTAHAVDGSGVRIRITGVPLGSGIPAAGQAPEEVEAQHVADDHFHAPNYLPGHPTAAALWPRVVRVPCWHDAKSGTLLCDGYDISPLRGEYLYVRPFLPKPAPAPPRTPGKKPLG